MCCLVLRFRLTPEPTAVRSSLVSSISSLLKTKDHKVSEKFHSSGAAKLCPPDNSAHVSAHNAVRFAGIASAVDQAKRARHARKVEEEYQKARKRAAKRGRELPPKDEYYNHWGYSYYGRCYSSACSTITGSLLIMFYCSIRAMDVSFLVYGRHVLRC